MNLLSNARLSKRPSSCAPSALLRCGTLGKDAELRCDEAPTGTTRMGGHRVHGGAHACGDLPRGVAMNWPEPLVRPPLKVGDPIMSVCGRFHPIALFLRGTPMISCPEGDQDPLRFPVIFWNRSICEVQRARD